MKKQIAKLVIFLLMNLPALTPLFAGTVFNYPIARQVKGNDLLNFSAADSTLTNYNYKTLANTDLVNDVAVDLFGGTVNTNLIEVTGFNCALPGVFGNADFDGEYTFNRFVTNWDNSIGCVYSNANNMAGLTWNGSEGFAGTNFMSDWSFYYQAPDPVHIGNWAKIWGAAILPGFNSLTNISQSWSNGFAVSAPNGLFTTTSNGLAHYFVTANSQQTRAYSAGALSIEEDLPLGTFGYISGVNPMNIQTASPFFTTPALQPWTGSSKEYYQHQVPQWVTNAIFRLQYEYPSTQSLTWTNELQASTSLGGYGRFFDAVTVQEKYTLAPTNYTYVFITNSWPLTTGTNAPKTAIFHLADTTAPTNSTQVNIVGVHVWWTGYYDGTNW